MEHLLYWSKCSIFHNIFKSIFISSKYINKECTTSSLCCQCIHLQGFSPLKNWLITKTDKPGQDSYLYFITRLMSITIQYNTYNRVYNTDMELHSILPASPWIAMSLVNSKIKKKNFYVSKYITILHSERLHTIR